MPAGQGSAGGSGSGGGPKGGPQGSSAGRPSSTTGGPVGGPSTAGPSVRQGAATGPGISGTSPSHMETMGGQQSAQADTPFGTDGTTGSPVASKKGCGCCGGVMAGIIAVTIVVWIIFSLLV
jgi:hypothetical protein